MKIDLDKGAFIQIGGELGKYNSIPVDYLAKFALDFQKLIQTIAKYDLPTNEAIDLGNFKIELTDFKKGSAVPKFAFSTRAENSTGQNWRIQRQTVNDRLEKLLEVSHTGDYSKITELYPEPFKRNLIVQDLYEFTNDFGNAPVAFVDYNEKQGKVVQLFKINKFKQAVKKSLITEVKDQVENSSESGIGVAKVRFSIRDGKTTKNIVDFYKHSNISLEFAPDIIVTNKRKYILKYPLRCLFEKEDGFFIIQSEMLNIIGTGMTEDEAEKAFSGEFDFVFQRFNSLPDDSLTKHNILIKNILNQIVEKVE
jgi:hypothetical protein